MLQSEARVSRSGMSNPHPLTMIRSHRRLALWLASLAIATVSLYCNGDISDPQAHPASIAMVSGDGQTGAVGQSLPEPLVVRIEDAQGRPVAGVGILWKAEGGGSIAESSVLSGSDGLATVHWSLGQVAGEQSVTATVTDLPAVSFTATAQAGDSPQLVIAREPSAHAISGAPLVQQPIVRLDDGTGEALGSGIPVTASVEHAALTGTITVKSDEYGEVAFTNLALSGSDGSYALTFSAPGVTGVRSGAITLATASADQRQLVITTQPSNSAQGGVAFAQQPVLRVESGDGQPLGAGIAVTASVTGATLAGAVTVQSDASGEVRFGDLALVGGDGVYHLTFSAPDAPSIESAAITLATVSASAGQWTQPFAWPIVAVHMVLLPDGHVLTIGRTGTPQVWDPATGVFTAVPTPAWLFCAGHALLPDGRVLIAGGHITDGHGLPNITYFETSETWTSGAPMARGRWYPTATTMGNGDVVVLAGTDQDSLDVTIPEVWSNGSVRQLSGADLTLPWYPRSFLAPNGSLFVAGPTIQTRFLSTSGAGSWSNGPRHLYDKGRNYGAAVMYDDGKILYAGGAMTTNTAEVIDLNQTNPTWQWTGSMAFARRHLNLTVLPTGEVLATSGVAGTTFDDMSTAVHAAEMWSPATGEWTTLASASVSRGYHSTSVLLPDGRVLHAGSGNGAGAPDERNAEIFSPPYLLRGPRPEITSAPLEVHYGAQFRVETPQAGAITHVSLIRLGAATHAFDQNQRFQRLTFTADASGLTVTAPSSSNRAPPGHYMLFVLNASDIPSIAKIIRIF
jgi:hypothetical protein